ncbi:MAG: PKD domain-containing protein [Bacteroidota bacterium]|nr:PKD domain-containing protein [Bacteroidota bacterium]
MKKIYFLLIIILTVGFSLLTKQAQATHVMGSDITWKCLGNDSFSINAIAYRDCSGINLSGGGINIRPSCTGGTSLSGLGSIGSGLDITPKCKRGCSTCERADCPLGSGIEQYNITTTVSLKGCCKFTISWGQCCRNGAITTGASSANFYTESTIDICQKPCDNSPYFTNPPVAIFCTNQCVVLNPGANDDDRNGNGEADSLSYEFGDPLSSASGSIPYASGYAKDEPLKYVGTDKNAEFSPPICRGFHLDPETGDISFKATKEDITVMVIVVNEWRKDSAGVPRIIGTVRRDLQIRIMECPENQSPQIVTTPARSQFDFCANRGKCIDFLVFDPDADDSVTVSWNKQIKGATFTTGQQPDKRVKAQFCWTPKTSDVRSLAHQFVVTALDNACPVPGRTSKTIRIKVNPSPEASYSAVKFNCGRVVFRAIPTGIDNHSGYDYTWSGTGARNRVTGIADIMFGKGATYEFKYRAAGTYVYNLSITNKITGCSSVYTDSLKIDEYVGIDLPKDTTVCVGTQFRIQSSKRNGFPAFTYKWSTGATADFVLPTITKDTYFLVQIFDGQGCDNFDSMKVFAKKLPIPKLGVDRRKCIGDTVLLSTGLKGIKTFNWQKRSNTGTYSSIGSSITQAVKDSAEYVVLVYDSVGCYGTDTIQVRFNPEVKVDGRTEFICIGETKAISAGSGGTSWKWVDLRSGRTVSTSSIFNPGIVIGTREYLVTISQTVLGVICISEDTIYIEGVAKPKPVVKAFPALCINNPPILLNPYSNTLLPGESGTWSVFGNPLAIQNNYLSPAALGKGTWFVRYTIRNKYGCFNTDSNTIVVDTLPQIYTNPDTAVCTGNGLFNLIGTPLGGVWTGPGVVGGSTQFPKFDPKTPGLVNGSTYTLNYSYTDKNSARCNSKKDVKMTVLETPNPQAGQVGPFCNDGNQALTFPLVGSPAGGRWFRGDTILPAQAIQYNSVTNRYSFVPAFAPSGQYTIIYEFGNTFKGVEYCKVRSNALITVSKAAVLTLATSSGRLEFCRTEPLEAIASTSDQTGGSGSYTIDGLTKGLSGNNNNTRIDFSQLTAGTHKLEYSYRTIQGCVSKVSITLNLFDPSEVTIDPTGTVCAGDVAVLSATAKNANQYQWIAPEGGQFIGDDKLLTAQFQPSAQQITLGRFIVGFIAFTPGNPCGPDTAYATVKINIRPVSKFEADVFQGCAPLEVKFRANVPLANRYVWDFGDNTIDTTATGTVVHIYRTSGKYSVKLTVFTPTGCVDSLRKINYIEVYPSPIPDFRARPTLTTISLPKIEFFSEPYSLNTVPLSKYFWTFGDVTVPGGGASNEKNPIYTYSDTGKYTVGLRIKNPNGCEGDTIKIAYIDIRPEIIVFIPNSFTPDGMNIRRTGGKNEKFYPVISHYDRANMKVFNRWGQLLYETDNPTEDGWDGTFKGEPTQQDVYVYVVKAWSILGKEYTFTGSITLLR